MMEDAREVTTAEELAEGSEDVEAEEMAEEVPVDIEEVPGDIKGVMKDTNEVTRDTVDKGHKEE